MEKFSAWHLLVTASLWISCYLPVRVKSSTSHSARFALFIMTEAWLLIRYESVGFDNETNWQVNGTHWAGRGRLSDLAMFTTETSLPHLSYSRQKHTVSSADRQALCTVNSVQLATRAERGVGRISILESLTFRVDENKKVQPQRMTPSKRHRRRSERYDWLLTDGARCQSDAAVDWVGGRPNGAPREMGSSQGVSLHPTALSNSLSVRNHLLLRGWRDAHPSNNRRSDSLFPGGWARTERYLRATRTTKQLWALRKEKKTGTKQTVWKLTALDKKNHTVKCNLQETKSPICIIFTQQIWK